MTARDAAPRMEAICDELDKRRRLDDYAREGFGRLLKDWRSGGTSAGLCHGWDLRVQGGDRHEARHTVEAGDRIARFLSSLRPHERVLLDNMLRASVGGKVDFGQIGVTAAGYANRPQASAAGVALAQHMTRTIAHFYLGPPRPS